MNPTTRKPAVPPAIAILFGILFVSTGSIFIRYTQAYAPSLVIAAYRLALAALILLPLALVYRRQELAGLRRRDLGLALGSGFFLAIHFAAWISSLEYTTVASSTVLVSTTPLWVGLLAPIFLKEKLTRTLLAGMLAALVGGVVIGLSDVCAWGGAGLACPPLSEFVRGRAFLGDLLALLGALMAAFYVIIGRDLRVRVSLLTYVFVVYGAAALLLLAAVLAAGLPLLGYPPQAYAWFLALALVPQLLGHSTFNWALGYLPAAFVSITLLGEPVASTLWAYLLFGETPTPLKIFGAILILSGILIASLPVKPEAASQHPG